MTTTKGRVEIPKNVEEYLALAKKVYDKHVLDGAASPLHALASPQWNEVGPRIATCLARHLEAEDFKRKMENSYRERDLLLSDINELIRGSKNLLKTIHSKNPKRLGEWGFTVDDSPVAKKETDFPQGS